MDQSIVDVTGIPDVSVDDEVTIIGRQGSEEITAGDIAELTNTIHYEVVTRLPAVLPRLYLYAGQPKACNASRASDPIL